MKITLKTYLSHIRFDNGSYMGSHAGQEPRREQPNHNQSNWLVALASSGLHRRLPALASPLLHTSH